jgi:hypothetical protein
LDRRVAAGKFSTARHLLKTERERIIAVCSDAASISGVAGSTTLHG